MGFQQLVDEVGGGEESHLHALVAQGVAQSGGDVGFAGTDGAYCVRLPKSLAWTTATRSQRPRLSVKLAH